MIDQLQSKSPSWEARIIIVILAAHAVAVLGLILAWEVQTLYKHLFGR